MRDFVMPKCPEKWTYEERMFYRGIQEALETLAMPIKKRELSSELIQQIEEGKEDEPYVFGERKTNRIWVNGKPIYEYVCKMSMPKTNTWYASEEITNVDEVIDYRLMAKIGRTYYNNEHYYNSSNYIRAYFEHQTTNPSTYQFIYWASSATNAEGIGIVQYTKITDAVREGSNV